MEINMNKAGKFVSNLSGEAEYRSFLPAPLPPTLEMDEEMISLLVSASKHLYALESISSHIPNIKLFTSMYVRKEALMSSQIEGTQATLEDVLDPMIDKNANQDVSDVVNYVRATEFALNRLNSLPLCNRLIRETHAVLMENVRGQDKSPGEFKKSQNWIGPRGSSLKDTRYIPPNPEDTLECMSELEKYMNSDDTLDVLIQAALIHYQFETIHPFLDGNGRVGRLLITLFLMEKKALSSPALYISYFLKRNRIEYYDRMTEVRSKGNYEQWVKFFLRAIAQSAEDACITVKALDKLHEKNRSSLEALGRARANAKRLLEYIEENPIIETQKTAAALGLSYNTVASAIKNLCALGILEKSKGESRNKIFAYTAYLDILKKGTE
ncbi:MAG: Fic family protein [Clostridia bacterium]|nr:Fic family protein [Clostridia bacterium]